MNSLANVPNFLIYFISSLILLGAFLTVYTKLAPIAEWILIREGNRAVALALGAATLGFAIPLATAIVRTGTFSEMVVWAVVSALVQLACFAALRLLRRDAAAALGAGDMAEAIIVAFASVTLGLLNAACLT
jgi:putative membrane protein